MMTLLFMFLFLGLVGELAGFAFRITWNVMKFVLMFTFIPFILIAIVGGFVRMALPVLLIVGIVYLLFGGREVPNGR